MAAALLASMSVLPVGSARAEGSKRACVAASTDGQTLRQEDKLLEATEKFRLCAATACPSIVRSQCTRWLSEVGDQIPSVIVRAKDSSGADVLDATATLDDRAVSVGRPESIDPGEHVLVVTRAGRVLHQEKFLVVDGEKQRVLMAQPAAPSTNSPAVVDTDSSSTSSHASGIPVGAWVLGGFGVAALLTSGFFALRTSSELDTLRETCSPTCTSAQTSSTRTGAAITDVSLGVGLGAVGGAVLWALIAHSGSSSSKSAARGLEIGLRPTGGGALGVVALRY